MLEWRGVSVLFAIDCHDREVPPGGLAAAPDRGRRPTLWTGPLGALGEATVSAPHAIQWLSDNGPQYTATATVLYAHALGLAPITTPAYSPESNGLAEAFVHTFKRDYVHGAELRDAEAVRAQLAGWIDDYNRQAPHSAFGARHAAAHRIPGEPRTHAPICLANRGETKSVYVCSNLAIPWNGFFFLFL